MPTITSLAFRTRFTSHFRFRIVAIFVVMCIATVAIAIPVFANNAQLPNDGGSFPHNNAMVGIASTPSGSGYWLVASDGGVFSFGDAGFYGSAGGQHLNQPIVGIAATPTGAGYWLVASDGGVFTYGDARFYGSTGGQHLNQPIVGMAAIPSGNGYWLVAADGGVFTFGNAAFYGSTGGQRLNQPVVGIASTRTGAGYWLTAADGGIFTFGNAQFLGSTGSMHLNEPVTNIARSSGGYGYLLIAKDGGVFTFGDAASYGAIGGGCLGPKVIGIATGNSQTGYYVAAEDGQVRAFSPSQSTNCEIEYARRTPCWNNDGGQHIYISISSQHLWACSDKTNVQDTAVTTGAYSHGGTPVGNFRINSKQQNTYLTGRGYRSHVDYWMPFLRGYGLHDASWRSSFGGDSYKTVGSHGCVNMPPAAARTLYGWVNVGTTVTIYN